MLFYLLRSFVNLFFVEVVIDNGIFLIILLDLLDILIVVELVVFGYNILLIIFLRDGLVRVYW